MKAILTQTYLVDVDDEEHASALAMEMETTARNNMVSALERQGAEGELLEFALSHYIGVAVAVIPEEVVR